MHCDTCGFTLWNPIASLTVSSLSLYDDSRFRGRSILMLDTHEEKLEDVEESILFSFMKDIQTAVRAIKVATGSDRVNVAILGNAVSHIHAHLIPRYPQEEEHPNSSPWNDLRKKTPLSIEAKERLIVDIRKNV